jgi:prevent-host-death family protein
MEMEKKVGVRELKNETSRILERVERGESITVTRHGKPVARLVAVSTSPHLAALIASGEVRPGDGSRYIPRAITPLRGEGPEASDYVSEGRR